MKRRETFSSILCQYLWCLVPKILPEPQALNYMELRYNNMLPNNFSFSKTTYIIYRYCDIRYILHTYILYKTTQLRHIIIYK